MDRNKIFRVGIDRLSLYNFKINKMCDGLVINTSNDTFSQESTHVKDELFSLDTSVRIFKNGEVREFKTITFNPNKILHGQNVHNCREELIDALFELEKILNERGIEIDFTEAKINNIEINQNIGIDFKELNEVFLLFFSQKNNSKATFRNTDNIKFMQKLKSESFFYKNTALKIRAYDKTAEVNDLEVLNFPVTRVEYMFERQTYSYFLKKLGQDNTLQTLIGNIELIDYMFIYYLKKDFIKKSVNFLNENLKKTLEVQYMNFKKNNKLARETNRKQKRNVYKFLEEFWIFDYKFVQEIVKKHDRKSFRREKERVERLLKKHNNLEKLINLVDIFFTALIAFSAEDEEIKKSIKSLDYTKN